MRISCLCALAVCGALTLVSCAPGEQSAPPAKAGDADIKSMRAAGKSRLEALQAGDVEKYAGAYEEDAVVVPPYSPEIIGKASIRSRLAEALKEISIEAVSETREYQVLGPEWIAERGRYSWNVMPKGAGEPFMDSGNFMLLWHKQKDGALKIAWEMWTSSRPLVEPKVK